MSADVKKLLFFFGKTIVLVLVMDFALGLLLETLYANMSEGERGRANEAVLRSHAEVYVFGSSRALHHYNPAIIADSLHAAVFNAGRPAQTMLYHLTLLKMIMKRQKPAAVILDINEDEFVYEERKYDLLNTLLPYYRSDVDVRETIDKIKPGYKYFAWLHTLPYNSAVLAVAYRTIVGASDQKAEEGYTPKRGQRQSSPDVLDNCRDITPDSVMIETFREFVSLCRVNKISLWVVVSPRFATFKCPRNDFAWVKSEVQKSGVPFIDFSANPRFVDHHELMYDGPHLNEQGAALFSSEIAHLVKEQWAVSR